MLNNNLNSPLLNQSQSIIIIDNYEDLINILDQNNGIIDNNLDCANLYILDFNLLHNMGIELIFETLKEKTSNKIFIANCANSISYTLFCIQLGFRYILYNNLSLAEKISISEINKEFVIFTNQQKIIEYFKNNG